MLALESAGVNNECTVLWSALDIHGYYIILRWIIFIVIVGGYMGGILMVWNEITEYFCVKR